MSAINAIVTDIAISSPNSGEPQAASPVSTTTSVAIARKIAYAVARRPDVRCR